jgi:hypothetical protein
MRCAVIASAAGPWLEEGSFESANSIAEVAIDVPDEISLCAAAGLGGETSRRRAWNGRGCLTGSVRHDWRWMGCVGPQRQEDNGCCVRKGTNRPESWGVRAYTSSGVSIYRTNRVDCHRGLPWPWQALPEVGRRVPITPPPTRGNPPSLDRLPAIRPWRR